MLHFLVLLLLIISQCSNTSFAKVGTAAHYGAPYQPTACDDTSASQIPSSNLIAAAGEEIWYDGAACGKEYLVTCISPPEDCKSEVTIEVKIVDCASTIPSPPSADGTTFVLSTTAFSAISKSPASAIKINYEEKLRMAI